VWRSVHSVIVVYHCKRGKRPSPDGIGNAIITINLEIEVAAVTDADDREVVQSLAKISALGGCGGSCGCGC
jgi:hypothetical protein